MLLCIQTGKTVDDLNRMRFETQEFYLKSEQELRQLFPGCDEAFDNTVKIARMCNVDFTFHEYHLLSLSGAGGLHQRGVFPDAFARRALRSATRMPPQEYRERMEYEINAHQLHGLCEFHPLCKKRGICRPAVVSGGFHCLLIHITEARPHEIRPIFERFLNPERVSMPDFRYGPERGARSLVPDRVAQIVFGMAARGAIRDGSGAEFTFAETDVVAKLVPAGPYM